MNRLHFYHLPFPVCLREVCDCFLIISLPPTSEAPKLCDCSGGAGEIKTVGLVEERHCGRPLYQAQQLTPRPVQWSGTIRKYLSMASQKRAL